VLTEDEIAASTNVDNVVMSPSSAFSGESKEANENSSQQKGNESAFVSLG
jgi:hypothetical protein